MDIVLFGIQGSGKGTQGKILAGKIFAAYFETGGELRRLASENSELGKKVKSIIEAGHLVPTDVVMEIVKNFVTTIAKGDMAIIFDGIPRSLDQAEQFEKLMSSLGREFSGIYINLSEDEAMRRLTARRICSQCKKVFPATYSGKTCDACGGELVARSDDNPESIQTRFSAFYKETVPVIDRYRAHNRLIEIDGDRSIDSVTTEILRLAVPLARQRIEE